jgi:hypothetical protein
MIPAAIVLLAGNPPARAASEAAEGEGEGRVMNAIARMSDFLAATKQFGVTAEVGYDIVQEWGQKIEFGETRVVTIRRPDRFRMETTNRDGTKSGAVFDGKQIAIFDFGDKVYATAAKAGTTEEALAYVVNDLGIQLPMASFVSSRLGQMVKEWANDVAYVETSTIAGVACDHVALRGDWEDVQMWIAQGERPLLQRLVITYTRAEGKPQFWAQFRDWNLSPAADDSVFSFTPPAGLGRISFAAEAQKMVPAGAGGQP